MKASAKMGFSKNRLDAIQLSQKHELKLGACTSDSKPYPDGISDNTPSFEPYIAELPDRVPQHKLPRVDAPNVTALVVDFQRRNPVEGDWFSNDVHYFDMCLMRRPPSGGYFPHLFDGMQRLGKIFMAPAGYQFHAAGPPGRQHSLYVFLKRNPLFPDEERLLPQFAPVRQCLHLQNAAVAAVLRRIAQEVQAPNFASEMLVEGLGLVLLAESARVIGQSGSSELSRGGLSPWRRRAIEDRLHSDEPPPKLSELAELCGLSRRHLMRSFRTEMGQTIGEFANQIAAERARTLLSTTEKPISVISGELGFESAAAFSAAFRRWTGRTPRDFRTQSVHNL